MNLRNKALPYSVMYERVSRWTYNITPLPERYKFGNLCKKERHVSNERTVRYEKSGRCLLCSSETSRSYSSKKDARDMTAMHLYEDSL